MNSKFTKEKKTGRKLIWNWMCMCKVWVSWILILLMKVYKYWLIPVASSYISSSATPHHPSATQCSTHCRTSSVSWQQISYISCSRSIQIIRTKLQNYHVWPFIFNCWNIWLFISSSCCNCSFQLKKRL